MSLTIQPDFVKPALITAWCVVRVNASNVMWAGTSIQQEQAVILPTCLQIACFLIREHVKSVKQAIL